MYNFCSVFEPNFASSFEDKLRIASESALEEYPIPEIIAFLYLSFNLNEFIKPLTEVNPGIKPNPFLFTNPKTELTVPARVSLIALNATNGGEYVIAFDAVLEYQDIPKESNDLVNAFIVSSPKLTNASCNSGLKISYAVCFPLTYTISIKLSAPIFLNVLPNTATSKLGNLPSESPITLKPASSYFFLIDAPTAFLFSTT